jgi:hypothetical protein
VNAAKNNHNLGSIFDPILSLEAWRTKCDAENVGNVHVDITFLEAFLGDEAESKVRFQASLKRAVIKVYVSKRDPIKVVRQSVDRGKIAKSSHELSERRKTDFAATGGMELATTPQTLNANLAIAAGIKTEREEVTTVSSEIGVHNIQQYVSDDMYCWEITPRNNSALLGKIWNAVSEPRLSIIMSSANAKSADCEVRVVVECRRQDIEIRNIQLKDKKLSIPIYRDAKNNIVAAEAVIKKLIHEKGFNVDNFSEPFAPVTVTSITVAEE